MNEINVFKQEPQSDHLPFGHLRTQQEGALYEPASGLTPGTKSSSALVLLILPSLQNSEKINSVSYMPPSLWYLLQPPEWAF